jgi:hypothetical protein
MTRNIPNTPRNIAVIFYQEIGSTDVISVRYKLPFCIVFISMRDVKYYFTGISIEKRWKTLVVAKVRVLLLPEIAV